ELADLGGDLLGVAALLRTADAGNDAVGAELVAADHDADVGLKAVGPQRRVAERVVALEAAFDLRARGLFPIQTEGELRLTALFHRGDEFRQLSELSGTANDVHVRRSVEDVLLIFLRHAAEDADDLVGVALLVSAEPAESAVDFLLGVLADAAGVEEDDVGLSRLVGQDVALPAQRTDDQLAVEDVHLTADSFDVEFPGHRGPVLMFALQVF